MNRSFTSMIPGSISDLLAIWNKTGFMSSGIGTIVNHGIHSEELSVVQCFQVLCWHPALSSGFSTSCRSPLILEISAYSLLQVSLPSSAIQHIFWLKNQRTGTMLDCIRHYSLLSFPQSSPVDVQAPTIMKQSLFGPWSTPFISGSKPAIQVPFYGRYSARLTTFTWSHLGVDTVSLLTSSQYMCLVWCLSISWTSRYMLHIVFSTQWVPWWLCWSPSLTSKSLDPVSTWFLMSPLLWWTCSSFCNTFTTMSPKIQFRQ